MAQERLNLKNLVEALELHDAFGETPKRQIEDVIRTLFSTIEAAVIADNKVAIPGFGTFTKHVSTTTGKAKAKFTSSATFKAKVNG